MKTHEKQALNNHETKQDPTEHWKKTNYSHFGKVCHFIKYYIQYNLFKFDLKNFYNYN
jgi:hypothetical protein